MKLLRKVFFITAISIAMFFAFTAFSQKTYNQKVAVRELSYDNKSFTSLKGVVIKVRNGIRKISDGSDSFVLPVMANKAFYFENITPPEGINYTFITPTLSDIGRTPFQPSANILKIIFANESKRQAEENKIVRQMRNSYRKNLDRYKNMIDSLNDELAINSNLSNLEINRIQFQKDSLERILKKLPKDVNMNQVRKEAERLSKIDCYDLSPSELDEINIQKTGDWEALKQLAIAQGIPDENELQLIKDSVKYYTDIIAKGIEGQAIQKSRLNNAFDSYRKMYTAYVNQYNNDSAWFYLKKIVTDEYAPIPDLLEASEFLSGRLNNYQEALSMLNKAEKTVKLTDFENILRIKLNLADLNFAIGDIKASETAYDSAMAIINEQGLHENAVGWEVKSHYGSFKIRTGELKNGISLLNECDKQLPQIAVSDYVKYYFQLDYINSLFGKFNTSKLLQYTDSLLNNLANLTEDWNTLELKAQTLSTKANLLMSVGKIPEAEKCANKSIDIIREVFGADNYRLYIPFNLLAQTAQTEAKISKADSLNKISVKFANNAPDKEIALIDIFNTTSSILISKAEYSEAKAIAINQIEYIKAKYNTEHHLNLLNLYKLLYTIYVTEGDLKNALAAIEEQEKILKNNFDEENTFYAFFYIDKAEILSQKFNRYNESEKLLLRAVEIIEKDFDSEQYQNSDVYNSLAYFYLSKSDYDNTELFFNKAKNTLFVNLGDFIRPYHPIYSTEVSLLWTKGKFKESYKIIKNAITESTNDLGKSHPTTAYWYEKLGDYYNNISYIKEAYESYKYCVEIYKSVYGVDSYYVCKPEMELAQLASLYGKKDEFRKLTNHIVNISKNTFGYDNVSTLSYMLSSIDSDEQPKEALAKVDTILSLIEKNSPDIPFKYSVLNNKARILKAMAKYSEALSIINNCIEWRGKEFGENMQAMSDFLKTKSSILGETQHNNESLLTLKQALEIDSIFYGWRNLNTLNAAVNLAFILNRNGKAREALNMAQRVLKTQIEMFGEDSPLLTNTHRTISSIYHNSGNYEQAINHINKAISNEINYHGEKSTYLIYYYTDYGDILSNMLRIKEANEMYDKAKNIANNIYEDNHPKIIEIANRKASLLNKLCRYDDAISVYKNNIQMLKSSEYYVEATYVNLLLYLSDSYLCKHQYEEVKKCCNEVIEKFESIDNNSDLLATLSRLRQAEFESGNIDKAFSILDREEFMINSLGIDDKSFQFSKANLLTKLGKLPEAIQLIDSVINKYNISDTDILYKTTILPLLSVISSNKKDWFAARKYKQQIINYCKDNFGIESPQTIIAEFEYWNNEINLNNYNIVLENLTSIINRYRDLQFKDEKIFRDMELSYLTLKSKSNPDISIYNKLNDYIDFYESIYGKDNINLINVYSQISFIFNSLNKTEEALRMLDNAENLIQNNSIESISLKSTIYNQRSNIYSGNKDILHALEEIEKSINLWINEEPSIQKDLNLASILCAKANFLIGKNFVSLDDIVEIERIIQYSDSVYTKIYGDIYPEKPSIYHLKSGVAYLKNNPMDAITISSDLIDTYIKLYGEDSPILGTTYSNLAMSYLSDAQLNNNSLSLIYADEAVTKSIEILKNSYGDNFKLLSNDYNIKLNILNIKKSKDPMSVSANDFIEYIDKGLAVAKYNFTEKSHDYIHFLQRKGLAYQNLLLENEKAESTFLMAVNLAKETFGEDNYFYYDTKASLANHYMQVTNHSSALPIYKEVIEYLQQNLPISPQLVNMFISAGNACKELRDTQNALLNYNNAIDVLNKMDIKEGTPDSQHKQILLNQIDMLINEINSNHQINNHLESSDTFKKAS